MPGRPVIPRRDALKILSSVPATWIPFSREPSPAAPLIFSCLPNNDLYRVLASGGRSLPRYDTPGKAVDRSPHGSGVLILAGGYPNKTTQIENEVFRTATQKKLRLYVEFPSLVPGCSIGEPRAPEKGRGGNVLERVVVTSSAFSPSLPGLQILDIHDCQYVPVETPTPVQQRDDVSRAMELVLARVAGYDTAVYGLPSEGVKPILFTAPQGEILIATTKLSQFLTGRYEPVKAWGIVWNWILQWLCTPSSVRLKPFEAVVHPAFNPGQALPDDAEFDAFRKGVNWYSQARLIVDPSWEKTAEERAVLGHASPPPPPHFPVGDGSEGVLEGFSSTIEPDGSQLLGWGRRNDCIGETSMAVALSSTLGGNTRDREIATNLNDFIYFHSELAQGPRNDPASPSYGLVGWGLPKSAGVYYGDDNARSLLGTMATAAVLKSTRWDELVLRCLLANLRTSGKLGFRGNRLDEKALQRLGWRHYFDAETVNYAPHYEAYLWACYLWAYDKTRYSLFRQKATTALRMTVQAYPDQWRWTNGFQQERARMLLPLAWLIRMEDTSEHRQWLKRIATDLLALQVGCGAIREEIGIGEHGKYGPPQSNDSYGTKEAPLIQANGDPACDLLYTCNFAFLGLHEAAAATHDPFYSHAADRLADFLCRIQVSSSLHPELDGGWFRAFDYKIWDYWASNSDAGWGAWSIESGWTQAWIASVFALRHGKTSFWELTANSKIGSYLAKLLPVMMPGIEAAG